MIRGYKVFNPDFTCKGFQYEVGKTYEHTGDLGVCSSGFHFCEKLIDCYEYYSFQEENKIAEVIAHGKVLSDGKKSVTDKIEIVKEITWSECLNLVNHGKGNTGYRNTGDWNTGYWNTGNCNTGNCNTGDRNTGYRNTGDWNTGYWNTGNCNTGNWNTGNWNTGNWNTGDLNKTNHSTGVLCTEEQKILIFDKPSNMTLSEWHNSKFADLFCWYELNKWVCESDMTDEEKKAHPKFYVQGGYLKVFTPEEAWQNWFKTKTPEEIELLKQIPNWDAKKFEYITGLQIV